MRHVLLTTAFLVCASSASAEVWVGREGDCGEWQVRWIVEQETSGVWVGTADYLHIGGPCARATNDVVRGELRAVISGNHIFAVRTSGQWMCMYAGQRTGAALNRARGTRICENGRAMGFAMRFRSQAPRSGALPPPDEDLMREEGGPSMRFEFRGLDQLFER